MKYRVLIKYLSQPEQILSLSTTLDRAFECFNEQVAQALQTHSVSYLKLTDDDGILYALWEA